MRKTFADNRMLVYSKINTPNDPFLRKFVGAMASGLVKLRIWISGKQTNEQLPKGCYPTDLQLSKLSEQTQSMFR